MDKLHYSDQELVALYLQGDHNSFEIILNRHKNKVYSYIYMMVRNTHLSEDIFQDTFIKVIKSLKEGKYHDDGKFLSWIMRISHNLIIDHFRKEKQLKVVSDDKHEVSVFNNKKLAVENIEDSLIEEQIKNDAKKLLDYLPFDQREVIILRLYAGLSFKEIAEQTEVSLNTALGRMRYALINLRKIVAEKGISLTK